MMRKSPSEFNSIVAIYDRRAFIRSAIGGIVGRAVTFNNNCPWFESSQ